MLTREEIAKQVNELNVKVEGFKESVRKLKEKEEKGKDVREEKIMLGYLVMRAEVAVDRLRKEALAPAYSEAEIDEAFSRLSDEDQELLRQRYGGCFEFKLKANDEQRKEYRAKIKSVFHK